MTAARITAAGTSTRRPSIWIRRKLHIAEPMSIDEALYEMELIGHDFFLFVNKETGRPSVVYHRHGWSYGVFEIDTPENIKNK